MDHKPKTTQSTRQNSILDNILINFSTDSYKIEQFDPGLSDHSSQIVTIPKPGLFKTISEKKTIKSRPITQSGKITFYNIVKELDWSYVDKILFCLVLWVDVKTKP